MGGVFVVSSCAIHRTDLSKTTDREHTAVGVLERCGISIILPIIEISIPY